MADGFDPDAYLKKKSTSQSFDPDAYLANKSKPEKSTFQKVTEGIDSVTGAPSRAAVSKLLDKDVLGAASAFADNFAGDVEKAPSQKDLALKSGFSDLPVEARKKINSPSLKSLLTKSALGTLFGNTNTQVAAQLLDANGATNADVAGFAIGQAADWTNLIPLVGMIKKGNTIVKGADNVTDALKLIKAAQNGTDKVADVAKAASKADDLLDTVKMTTKADDALDVARVAPDAEKVGMKSKDVITLANEGSKKANADDILKAARELGFEPTPAMLSDNFNLKALESSLDQSPTIGGMSVRGGKTGTNQVREGLKKAVNKFGDGTSARSKLDAGDLVKSDILETLNQQYEPIAKNFESIAGETKLIGVPDKVKELASKRFLRQKQVVLSPESPWGTIARRYSNDIKNVKNVDDIKQLRTLALKEARSATDSNVQSTLGYISGQLQALEGATIKNAARASAANPKEGLKLGNGLVQKLRSTRKDFRGFIEPLRDISSNSGLRDPKSLRDFVDNLTELNSEDVAKTMFRTNNFKGLKLIKEKFPNSFNTLRQDRIGDIIEKSMHKGEIVPSKLLKNLKAIGPEARELIFESKDVNKSVDALETILNSIPDKIGPSGTPQGEMLRNIVNIPFQGTELGRAALYKAMQNPTQPISKVIKFGQQAPSKLRKAGQVSSQALPDLLGVSKAAQVGLGVNRGLSDLIKERKK